MHRTQKYQHKPIKGCWGKSHYTKVLATEVAAERTKELRKPFNAYHCKHCDTWHVGHTPYYERRKVDSANPRVDHEIARHKRQAENAAHKRTMKRKATRKRAKARAAVALSSNPS